MDMFLLIYAVLAAPVAGYIGYLYITKEMVPIYDHEEIESYWKTLTWQSLEEQAKVERKKRAERQAEQAGAPYVLAVR